ncbi:MAG: hypothetical protein AMS17_12805 [Spirochaetes bacterium DG_61]|jgi:medium-chain acyl-[acyl-carrier-protein] hydrolase|nr:MAG: hypothetical protein AMS17_12805 [Spirochaetes bacterium DG_61]
MEKIWTDRYTISSYEVDIKARVYLPVLCSYLQESAWHHAHNLKLGYDHLLQKNKIWVLSRLCIEVRSYPRWREKITVRTWPKGLNRLFALRDFEILDAEEHVLGVATTSWLIIDVKSRRPQKPDPFFKDMPLPSDHHALRDDFEKIPQVSGDAARLPISVRYSDLDLYSHVNNTKYIEWIMDSFGAVRYREQMVSSLKIQYLSESFWGDTISLLIGQEAEPKGTFLFNAVKTADSSEIFRATVRWGDE